MWEQKAFVDNINGLSMNALEKRDREMSRLNNLNAEMIGKLALKAREEIRHARASRKKRDNQKMPRDTVATPLAIHTLCPTPLLMLATPLNMLTTTLDVLVTPLYICRTKKHNAGNAFNHYNTAIRVSNAGMLLTMMAKQMLNNTGETMLNNAGESMLAKKN